jgi:hypothetical protein
MYLVSALVASSMLLVFSTVCVAGVPFPGTSTCTVTITQFPPRPACITLFEPSVVRLTPAGSNASPLFDRVTIATRVRTADGEPVANALVTFTEQEIPRRLNIANGGATSAMTDSQGFASVTLHAASGYGRVALCADGVSLCELQVRSPDVTTNIITTPCGLGTGSSGVSGTDITHATCGYLVHFGSVTPGVNDGYDLNCDANVTGADVTGILGKGGVLQYFGDVGTLGDQTSCAP